MLRGWTERHRSIMRALSLAVSAAFIVTSMPVDARAAVEMGEAPYAISDDYRSAYSRFDLDTFSIPAHLGDVKYQFKGDSDKFVLHIQDAHCNCFAQHKVSEIIGYLNREYGVRTVNLEGGVGEYDLEVFTSISGEAIRREVADYFVEKGEINGAEYYAINNPENVTLWGVEDKDLYLANLKVYRDSLNYREEVDEYLKQLTHIFNNFKRKIYSPELLEIDMAYGAYKAGNMEFRDYIEFIIGKAREHGIQVKEFRNVYLLAQAMDQEKDIDFKKANTERSILIDELKKGLSREEIRELVTKTVQFKTKRLSRKAFYGYLLEKAKEIFVDLDEFPALQSYIVYVSTYEAVDRSLVMEELDAIEKEIKEPLYKNEKQRRLNTLSRNLALMKNIFAIQLTKNDYKYYLANKDSFDISNYLAFIEKEAPLYRIDARPDPDITRIDAYREEISKFYEYSFRRDDVFIGNLRFDGLARGGRGAFLMTGGFHTENLCELFRRNGISYVSILPKFTSGRDYESPYFDILAGQMTDIQQMMRSAIARAASAMMQVASKLNPILGEAVWGDNAVYLLRAEVHIRTMIAEARAKGEPVSIELRIDEADENPAIFGDARNRVAMTPVELLEAVGYPMERLAIARAETPAEAEETVEGEEGPTTEAPEGEAPAVEWGEAWSRAKRAYAVSAGIAAGAAALGFLSVGALGLLGGIAGWTLVSAVLNHIIARRARAYQEKYEAARAAAPEMTYAEVRNVFGSGIIWRLVFAHEAWHRAGLGEDAAYGRTTGLLQGPLQLCWHMGQALLMALSTKYASSVIDRWDSEVMAFRRMLQREEEAARKKELEEKLRAEAREKYKGILEQEIFNRSRKENQQALYDMDWRDFPIRFLQGETPSGSRIVGASRGENVVLGEELGKGGFATVYKGTAYGGALAERLKADGKGRDVAVKVLEPGSTPAAVLSFLHEYYYLRMLSGIDGVVDVYDAGVFIENGEPNYYIVMEYAEGKPLDEAIEDGLSTEEAASVSGKLLSTLSEINDMGVLHRDIKPENIIYDPETGEVKVMDFGIAAMPSEGPEGARYTKAEGSESMVGSLLYFSPRVSKDLTYDHGTDMHALKLVMYQMFMGVLPYYMSSDPTTRKELLGDSMDVYSILIRGEGVMKEVAGKLSRARKGTFERYLGELLLGEAEWTRNASASLKRLNGIGKDRDGEFRDGFFGLSGYTRNLLPVAKEVQAKLSERRTRARQKRERSVQETAIEAFAAEVAAADEEGDLGFDLDEGGGDIMFAEWFEVLAEKDVFDKARVGGIPMAKLLPGDMIEVGIDEAGRIIGDRLGAEGAEEFARVALERLNVLDEEPAPAVPGTPGVAARVGAGEEDAIEAAEAARAASYARAVSYVATAGTIGLGAAGLLTGMGAMLGAVAALGLIFNAVIQTGIAVRAAAVRAGLERQGAEDLRAAAPTTTYTDLVERFGPYLAPFVHIHEAQHRTGRGEFKAYLFANMLTPLYAGFASLERLFMGEEAFVARRNRQVRRFREMLVDEAQSAVDNLATSIRGLSMDTARARQSIDESTNVMLKRVDGRIISMDSAMEGEEVISSADAIHEALSDAAPLLGTTYSELRRDTYVSSDRGGIKGDIWKRADRLDSMLGELLKEGKLTDMQRLVVQTIRNSLGVIKAEQDKADAKYTVAHNTLLQSQKELARRRESLAVREAELLAMRQEFGIWSQEARDLKRRIKVGQVRRDDLAKEIDNDNRAIEQGRERAAEIAAERARVNEQIDELLQTESGYVRRAQEKREQNVAAFVAGRLRDELMHIQRRLKVSRLLEGGMNALRGVAGMMFMAEASGQDRGAFLAATTALINNLDDITASEYGEEYTFSDEAIGEEGRRWIAGNTVAVLNSINMAEYASMSTRRKMNIVRSIAEARQMGTYDRDLCVNSIMGLLDIMSALNVDIRSVDAEDYTEGVIMLAERGTDMGELSRRIIATSTLMRHFMRMREAADRMSAEQANRIAAELGARYNLSGPDFLATALSPNLGTVLDSGYVDFMRQFGQGLAGALESMDFSAVTALLDRSEEMLLSEKDLDALEAQRAAAQTSQDQTATQVDPGIFSATPGQLVIRMAPGASVAVDADSTRAGGVEANVTPLDVLNFKHLIQETQFEMDERRRDILLRGQELSDGTRTPARIITLNGLMLRARSLEEEQDRVEQEVDDILGRLPGRVDNLQMWDNSLRNNASKLSALTGEEEASLIRVGEVTVAGQAAVAPPLATQTAPAPAAPAATATAVAQLPAADTASRAIARGLDRRAAAAARARTILNRVLRSTSPAEGEEEVTKQVREEIAQLSDILTEYQLEALATEVGRVRREYRNLSAQRAEVVEYHDFVHTMDDVRMVAQGIARMKARGEKVDAKDAFKTILAALYHDIGYSQPETKTHDHVENSVNEAEKQLTERFARAARPEIVLTERDIRDVLVMIAKTSITPIARETQERVKELRQEGLPAGNPSLEAMKNTLLVADLTGAATSPRYFAMLTQLYREYYDSVEADGFGSALQLLDGTAGFQDFVAKAFMLGGELGLAAFTTNDKGEQVLDPAATAGNVNSYIMPGTEPNSGLLTPEQVEILERNLETSKMISAVYRRIKTGEAADDQIEALRGRESDFLGTRSEDETKKRDFRRMLRMLEFMNRMVKEKKEFRLTREERDYISAELLNDPAFECDAAIVLLNDLQNLPDHKDVPQDVRQRARMDTPDEVRKQMVKERVASARFMLSRIQRLHDRNKLPGGFGFEQFFDPTSTDGTLRADIESAVASKEDFGAPLAVIRLQQIASRPEYRDNIIVQAHIGSLLGSDKVYKERIDQGRLAQQEVPTLMAVAAAKLPTSQAEGLSREMLREIYAQNMGSAVGYHARSRPVKTANELLERMKDLDQRIPANSKIKNIEVVETPLPADFDAESYMDGDKLVIVLNTFMNRHLSFRDNERALAHLIRHEFVEATTELDHEAVKALEVVENNGDILTVLNDVDLGHMTLEQLQAVPETSSTDPTGRFYQAAQLQFLARALADVLARSRPGLYPTVMLMPVDADQLLYDGSQYTAIKNGVRRTLQKNYGQNINVVYYRANASDMKTEMAEAVKAIEGTKGFGADTRSRVVAFADASSYDAVNGALASFRTDNKLAGVVKGDFLPEAETERFSIVSMATVGVGLADWHRADSLGQDTRELEKFLQALLLRLVENPAAIQQMDPSQLMKQLLEGAVSLAIRKINYDEIRDYMDSESAVMESL